MTVRSSLLYADCGMLCCPLLVYQRGIAKCNTVKTVNAQDTAAAMFGHRVARLAVLRPNFGNLAVLQVFWAHDYLVGRLAIFGLFCRSFGRKFFLLAVFENMPRPRFSRKVNKLSMARPLLKSRRLCVRFALCSEL